MNIVNLIYLVYHQICKLHFIQRIEGISQLTRMPSSRMRTVRNSRGVLDPGGCLLPQGFLLPQGCLLLGGGIPACTEADPPIDRMTDRCKNITFATSFRTVITFQRLTTYITVVTRSTCVTFISLETRGTCLAIITLEPFSASIT